MQFPCDVVGMRRELHRFPETAFLEYRTASVVAERLSQLGYAVKTGADIMCMDDVRGIPSAGDVHAAKAAALQAGAYPKWLDKMPDGQTAVCGEMRRGTGPVLALRFDMDALPVHESDAGEHRPASEGFASQCEGRMHACGHDGHTAIGLAVAERLAWSEARWNGTLRFIFQPAEEGGRGAQPVVASGLLDDVDIFLASHLGCQLPSGQIALAADGFLWAEKWNVTFSGTAAHAAMCPEKGRNALLAAALAVPGLYALPRDGQSDTRINVGLLQAGRTRNVIADRAYLELELRASAQEGLQRLTAGARRAFEGAAVSQGVHVDIDVYGTAISAQSDETIMKRLEVAVHETHSGTVVRNWPIGGGDDATFMMQRVQERGGQAGYCLIGADIAAPHHASLFDFDEAVLENAVKLLTAFVERSA
ncbi:amidohydrolase [Gluconobacter oxydans]|uniref:amidohydrolase n=1 Tax=Gluconobacter thailandicus TaxID=257438 RepID=UPI0002999F9C|nr:amidohydrolase [Gluconobacter thailandicus]AFW02338.1 amidohydrolase [Gluconobacter oxydans H24]ANQ42147.1 amidohydrolase [Gluconobacter oxydans]